MPVEPAVTLSQLARQLAADEQQLVLGGGMQAIERQRAKKRLFVRDRLRLLLDEGTPWLELGLWAGWEMYAEWGGAPAAGVVTGIGTIAGRRHMIIANDATVKAGAFFPATAKKVLAGPADRHAEPPAAGLSGRFGRRVPAAARRRLSRRRRFRPHLSQQRRHLGRRAGTDRRHHGQLRRRRRLSAGAVRQAADDRRLGLVSGRPGAGEKRHRPGGFAARNWAAPQCTPR